MDKNRNLELPFSGLLKDLRYENFRVQNDYFNNFSRLGSSPSFCLSFWLEKLCWIIQDLEVIPQVLEAMILMKIRQIGMTEWKLLSRLVSFHWRSSSIQRCFSSEDVFHWRLSSKKGCLQSKVLFHPRFWIKMVLHQMNSRLF